MNTWLRKAILAAALIAGLAPVMAQVPPPVPGLPDTERRTSYTLAGTNCACSVGFALYGDSTDYQDWLEVFINGTQVTYNDPVFGWTITSPTGPLATIARPITDGVLTFNSVQTGTIQIVGARRPRRVSQFNENTGVPARNLNQALTDIVAQNREVWDKINDVTGRVVRAPPGETMATLPPAASRANQGVCFDSLGNLIPCIGLPGTSSFSAGNGITFTGSSPTVISDNAQGSAPIVVTPGHPTTIACPTCNTGQSSTFIPITSRAAALSLNLSAYASIQTGGYTTSGDGGGAMYKNIGTSGTFQDTVPTWTLTTAGTGCTNGATKAVFVSNTVTGVGTLGTATVSGGSVTSTAFTTPGAGYAVGDQAGANGFPGTLPGCSVQPVWTVSSVSAVTCSFTDAAGTRFQELIDRNKINAKACGVKNDWVAVTCTDSCATNNQTALQNALWFAYAQGSNPTIDAYGTQGATVVLPPKVTMACSLTLPGSVVLEGAGRWSTILKDCDAEASANPFITIGDAGIQLACFGSAINDIGIWHGSETNGAGAGAAMIFSNCIQQQVFLQRVNISASLRNCISLQSGFGGAAEIGMRDIECGTSQSSTNSGILMNYSTAIADMYNVITEIPGNSISNIGLNIQSGRINLLGYHCEGFANCISMNVAANNGISSFRHLTGSQTTCTNLILRQAGSAANVNFMEMALGCTNTLNNAGALTTGNIIGQTIF